MIEKLIDLKENHNVLGVKAEFESEGSTIEEVVKLKELATKADLDLTIKIGGCEAIKDIYDAKKIGIETLVAPMIESPYAMKKYIEATKRIFTEQERKKKKFLINIETIYGFNYLKDIMNSPYSNDIAGIVFGRTDMTGSLGMDINDVNSPEILKYAQIIGETAIKHKKEFIIGGGVSACSLPFFKKLPKGSLTKFETRKIIFDAQKALNDKYIEYGIYKAIDFEVMWLKNKQNSNPTITKEDLNRIKILEKRNLEYKKLIQI